MSLPESRVFREPEDIFAELGRGDALTIPDVYQIWEHREPVPDPAKAHKSAESAPAASSRIRWMQRDLSHVAAFTALALKKGEFLLVCDAYGEAATYWSGRVDKNASDWKDLNVAFAKAKTRLNFFDNARQALRPLAGNMNLGTKERAEVLTELGNTYREESHYTEEPAQRVNLGEKAHAYYQEALKVDPEMLDANVLNAAMALILSERGTPQRERAAELGRHVLALIDAIEERKGATFQTTWFRAVAQTVAAEPAAAFDLYKKLIAFSPCTSDLAEARYRARFLAGPLGEARKFFDDAFPPLDLIVFAGHNVDRAGLPPRFPLGNIPIIKERLREKLAALQARVGLVSAAAGADLLFIEALRERPGSEYHVVLPWSEEEFRRTSVLPFEEKGKPPFWDPLFEAALQNAASVRKLGQAYEPGDAAGWEFTQEVAAGLALLTARLSRLDVRPISLWDGMPGRGAGGTASFVSLWDHYLQQAPDNIALPSCRPSTEAVVARGGSRSERPTMHQEVKSILFADIVGYSKLTEKVIHDFVEVFMQKLSRLLADSRHAPRSVNTWGDAIYGVFDYADDAGRFALELIRMINDGRDEWISRGLFYEELDPVTRQPVLDPKTGKAIQHPLNVRVGLHTGPVFVHYNPVVRQLGYTGSHVSRAARIEPVAASGEVYASEEFAAMAELGKQIRKRRNESDGNTRNEGGFLCEYAGTMPLAKNYPGRFRIYRVVPHRTLPLENLAQAIHELYREERAKDPHTERNMPALRPWKDLAESYREANRAQAADIPNKLDLLGYELAPIHGLPPSELQIAPEKLEELAQREHLRWLAERQRQGWIWGPERDAARRHNPTMVPWEKLVESEKQKDRDTVLNLRKLLVMARFRVRPLKRPV